MATPERFLAEQVRLFPEHNALVSPYRKPSEGRRSTSYVSAEESLTRLSAQLQNMQVFADNQLLDLGNRASNVELLSEAKQIRQLEMDLQELKRLLTAKDHIIDQQHEEILELRSRLGIH